MPLTVDADTVDAKRLDRRRDRFIGQAVNADLSPHSRVRGCGKVGVLADGGCAVRVTQGPTGTRAGFAGLATCGSVWLCPVCAEKILAGRQEEITAALAEWTAREGRVGFITLTMRHRHGQELADLWDAATDAWHRVTTGRAWMTDQATYGVPTERVVRQGHRKGQTVVEDRIGWIKVVEVTHGRNGWHVHLHVAVMLAATATARDVDDLGCSMFQRWSHALVAAGLEAPMARHGGLDARLWESGTDGLSSYFTKNTYRSTADRAALELTRSDLKSGRAGNRTPFQILAEIADGYLARDAELWDEFSRAAHGRRQVSWSMGLRANLLPDVAEQTDEELAEVTIDGEAVVVITRTGVRTMVRAGLKAAVLEAAEQGYYALQTLLLHYGIDFAAPTPDLLRDTRYTLAARQAERAQAA